MGATQSPFAHTGLVVGSGCLVLSIGPLLVFGLLQGAFGAFHGNNGLGLGLWFAVSAPVAVLALVVGLVVDCRRRRSGSSIGREYINGG